MEINYKRNLNQSYMVIDAEAFYSGYQLHMCKENHIAHLLPFDTIVEDGQMKFWYEITGKKSLEHVVESREFNLDVFIRLLETLSMVARAIRPYLLEEEGLLLSPDTIFIENGGRNIFLGYCPGKHEAIIDNFRHLMEYLLSKINHEDEVMVLAGYEAYQRATEEGFSIDGILRSISQYRISEENGAKRSQPDNHINEIERTQGTTNLSMQNREEAWENRTEPASEQSADEKLRRCIQAISRVPAFLLAKFGKEKEQVMYLPTDYEEQKVDEPTVCLTQEEGTKGILQYAGSGEVANIMLDHFPFIIGSGEQADGKVLVHGVSRLHARITKEKEEYYIEDLNSMNGTWLNEQALVYRERERISMHDQIQLGREKFVFM